MIQKAEETGWFYFTPPFEADDYLRAQTRKGGKGPKLNAKKKGFLQIWGEGEMVEKNKLVNKPE